MQSLPHSSPSQLSAACSCFFQDRSLQDAPFRVHSLTQPTLKRQERARERERERARARERESERERVRVKKTASERKRERERDHQCDGGAACAAQGARVCPQPLCLSECGSLRLKPSPVMPQEPQGMLYSHILSPEQDMCVIKSLTSADIIAISILMLAVTRMT